MKSFKNTIVLLGVLLVTQAAWAQDATPFKWWNPAQQSFAVTEGQPWRSEAALPFDRLPARAEKIVTPAVWLKSRQTAGLVIRFRSDAPEIRVRYAVTGQLQFEHMPATGVSGVDLYSLNKDGSWGWTDPTYTFGDTIQYSYAGIRREGMREYYLYLPLYNHVKWLTIGVPENARLTPLKVREEQPIVVYGTSIAQGGVASRPGMAWTALLGRSLHLPVVNLGFSSNGLLDEAFIKLIAEIDARIYILDCFPNMIGFAEPEVRKRIEDAVQIIQDRRPGTPVLFADHADANIGLMDTVMQDAFARINRIAYSEFNRMRARGIQNIYYLKAGQIGLDIESTVDGQHPNDMGMKRYASAYEEMIKAIRGDEGTDAPRMPVSGASVPRQQITDVTSSTWNGFQQLHFKLYGRNCILVKPHRPAPGNPWIWRTEFFGAFAQADSMLAAKGFHVAYTDLTDLYGAAAALDDMTPFYHYLVDVEQLSPKVVLEGFSRGGLSALNWAILHPAWVSSLYLDAAVCDFKSWPGGPGRTSYSHGDWEKLKLAYGFTSDQQALDYGGNPIDHISALAKYKIPILSICGARDTLVPIEKNANLLKSRYKRAGGEIRVIVKPGVFHHPHSLTDPTPIVQFIVSHEN